MFGMGFTEILLIAVMAIIFIGPDKLPKMMIDIAKIFRNVKNTIGTVKENLEEEINLTDIQKEAMAYKEELMRATEEVSKVTQIPNDISTGLTSLNNDILNMDDTPKTKKEPETVTFSKKEKKKKEKQNIDEDNVDV